LICPSPIQQQGLLSEIIHRPERTNATLRYTMFSLTGHSKKLLALPHRRGKEASQKISDAQMPRCPDANVEHQCFKRYSSAVVAPAISNFSLSQAIRSRPLRFLGSSNVPPLSGLDSGGSEHLAEGHSFASDELRQGNKAHSGNLQSPGIRAISDWRLFGAVFLLSSDKHTSTDYSLPFDCFTASVGGYSDQFRHFLSPETRSVS
jgi:hypothetical protein